MEQGTAQRQAFPLADGQEPQADKVTIALHKNIKELILDTSLQYRYFTARSSFLIGLERWTLFFAFVSSIIAFIVHGMPATALSLISAMLTLGLLVFNSSQNIKDTLELKNDFAKLESDLFQFDDDQNVTFECYSKCRKKYNNIIKRANEPYRALEALCHNEVLLSNGYDPSNLIKIPRLYAFLSNVLKFRNFEITG